MQGYDCIKWQRYDGKFNHKWRDIDYYNEVYDNWDYYTERGTNNQTLVIEKASESRGDDTNYRCIGYGVNDEGRRTTLENTISLKFASKLNLTNE